MAFPRVGCKPSGFVQKVGLFTTSAWPFVHCTVRVEQMNNGTIPRRLQLNGARGFFQKAALIAGSAAAALLGAIVLSGSPVHAQTCPGAANLPTPTDVPVTAVPIVVTSTTADYFVLYASHEVVGKTVEYPVQVALGPRRRHHALRERGGAAPGALSGGEVQHRRPGRCRR